MIPEKEREAIMRLTMCARRNCAICIYGHNRKRTTVKLPQSCLDRITENMNILAAACEQSLGAVKIVHCKDCIYGKEISAQSVHCMLIGHNNPPNGYCWWGDEDRLRMEGDKHVGS